MKIVTAFLVSLPKSQLSSLEPPCLSSFPAKAQAWNLSGNGAASGLGRSPGGSPFQARFFPAVHAGMDTPLFGWSQQGWGHMWKGAAMQMGAKGPCWVTHKVFTLLCQPTPESQLIQALRNFQEDLAQPLSLSSNTPKMQLQ